MSAAITIAGKIYVAGAKAPRTTPGAAGYYVNLKAGLRLHDADGAPFAFAANHGGSRWLVTCYRFKGDGRIRYMNALTASDTRALGLDPDGPHAAQRQLADNIFEQAQAA